MPRITFSTGFSGLSRLSNSSCLSFMKFKNPTGVFRRRSMMETFCNLAATYYFIIDAILFGFFSYNAYYNRDKVVWLKSQFGLQFGVTLGLRMYLVPLILSLFLLTSDIFLIIGLMMEKSKYIWPSILIHAGKCLLTTTALIILHLHLPQINTVLTTALGSSIPIITVMNVACGILTLEIVLWLVTFSQFKRISKNEE
nr:uncharacterized protein LOC111418377 [Onthophagus taurus]